MATVAHLLADFEATLAMGENWCSRLDTARNSPTLAEEAVQASSREERHRCRLQSAATPEPVAHALLRWRGRD
jgi:hypothetical protein